MTAMKMSFRPLPAPRLDTILPHVDVDLATVCPLCGDTGKVVDWCEDCNDDHEWACPGDCYD